MYEATEIEELKDYIRHLEARLQSTENLRAKNDALASAINDVRKTAQLQTKRPCCIAEHRSLWCSVVEECEKAILLNA